MEILDETKIYNTDELKDAFVLDELVEICSVLKERGYNPIHQIVGYLLSGDLGYITSYKNARQRIQKLDRIKVLEVLVKKGIAL